MQPTTQQSGRFFLIDYQGCVVDWPAQTERSLGIDRKEALGKRCCDVLAQQNDADPPNCQHCPIGSSFPEQNCHGSGTRCSVITLPPPRGGAMVWLLSPFVLGDATEQALGELLLAGRLASALEQPDVTRRLVAVLDLLRGCLAADDAEIFVRLPGTQDVVQWACLGPNSDALSVRRRFSVDEGFAGAVISSRLSVLTRDLAADSRLIRHAVRDCGLRCFLGVPLTIHGLVLGSLHLGWRDPDAALEPSRDLLERIRDPISRSIRDGLARLPGSVPMSSVEAQPGAEPAQNRLVIRCLGSFEALRSGTPVRPADFQRKSALRLFKLLILNYGTPLPRDVIIEHLWPGADPGAGANRLYVAVHSLRGTLSPQREPGRSNLIQTSGGFFLLATNGCSIDLVRFRNLVSLVWPCVVDGRVGPPAVDWLVEAVELYRGELFAEDPYLEWCERQRKELAADHLRAAGLLVRHHVERGAIEPATELLRRVVMVDPGREDFQRTLAELLLQLGRKKEAATQLQDCMRYIRSELDSEPEVVTIQLWRRLSGDHSKL